MKSIRNIAFSALLTFGAFSAITYTACNKDECKDVVCQNGGTCSEGNCTCPTGFEGTNCETVTRDKFKGTWTGADVCNLNTYTVTLNVDASSSKVNALISNPGGFGNSVTITGVVSGTNKLTFTNQSVGGGRTLTGSMTFTGDAMEFEYTVTEALGTSDNCHGTYARQ